MTWLWGFFSQFLFNIFEDNQVLTDCFYRISLFSSMNLKTSDALYRKYESEWKKEEEVKVKKEKQITEIQSKIQGNRVNII